LDNVLVGVHCRAADHRIARGNGAAGSRKSDHGSSAEQFDLHPQNSFPSTTASLGSPLAGAANIGLTGWLTDQMQRDASIFAPSG
jgi:hypothetical protein